jgi:hypothetical protein
MDAVYYVIAILGCGDGQTQCAPVATVPTHYKSEAACAAATGEALMANSDFDYPTLVAQCQAGSARPAVAPKHERKVLDKPVVVAMR